MAGDARARGDDVLHARALLPSGPHRSVRAAGRRRGHRAGGGGDDRSGSARGRSRLRVISGSRGLAVEVGLRERGGRPAERGVLHADARGPAVRHPEGGDQPGRLSRAGARTGERQLTSAAANRHAHGVRAEVDAIGVGVGTILADDPLLTARGVYREGPLVRVIFDRCLRTPPAARVLSTRDAGPVIIVTEASAAARADVRSASRGRGRGDRGGARRIVRRGARAARRAAGRIAAARRRRRDCTRRRGTPASSTTCGSTSRRTSLAQAVSGCSTGGRFPPRRSSSVT